MSAISFPRMLLLLLLGLGGFQLLAEPVWAAEPGSLLLEASFLRDIVGDRSRMIQVSLVFVLVGCAMLWWRK